MSYKYRIFVIPRSQWIFGNPMRGKIAREKILAYRVIDTYSVVNFPNFIFSNYQFLGKFCTKLM